MLNGLNKLYLAVFVKYSVAQVTKYGKFWLQTGLGGLKHAFLN